jgi:iron-sulfur cluster repair protein YtfE (RIC family)
MLAMNAVERLRRDHQVLRGKLDVLEAALGLGPGVWFVLRELCFTLARQLADHIEREEWLIAASRQSLTPEIRAEMALEHNDEPQQLRTINELFLSESGYALDRIRPALTEAIARLRRHMAEEESGLFPLLDQDILSPGASRDRIALPFDETATVNRVIHEFPETKPVFERRFINIPAEGCDCLDEVAWRHGMEARELIEHLERAIRAGEPDAQVRADEAEQLAAAEHCQSAAGRAR